MAKEVKIDDKLDYSKDVGLKLDPKNEIDGLTYDIKKDLVKLKDFYGKDYQELVRRDVHNTVFHDSFEEKYVESDSFSVMQFNMLADSLSRAYSSVQFGFFGLSTLWFEVLFFCCFLFAVFGHWFEFV